MKSVRVLAISGSLREHSSNTALLRAIGKLAPEGMEFSLYKDMAELPPLNPDLDTESPPAPVARFRALLAAADGVVISSPEYAHGVPGVLKNALDWVVSSGEFVNKPVVLFNAPSRGSDRAQAQLIQTLNAMTAKVLLGASILAPSRPLADGAIADPDAASAFSASLDALTRTVAGQTVQ